MYEPIKKLGQNFLTDISVAERMVLSLNAAQDDTIIEIGPGLGVVTQILEHLTQRIPFELFAVEVDQRFVPKLNSMFSQNQNVHVVNEDVLKFLPEFSSDNDTKVIGSLPFYITSPIVHTIIKMKKQPSVAVLMIQKEVAGKIASFVPDASYFSTFVQTFYETKFVEVVPKNKFNPSPQVDAAIILLTKKNGNENDLVWTQELIKKYEGFLHRGFSNPRKMLNKVFSAEELKVVDVSPNLRPQNLEVDTWVKLFKNICL